MTYMYKDSLPLYRCTSELYLGEKLGYSAMILTNTRFRRRPPRLTRSALTFQRLWRAPGVRPPAERSVESSSRPLVTATTTFRPFMRIFACCVPPQVRAGNLCILGGEVSSVVRLCNRSLDRRRR
jgi:hypothetical protein